MDSTAELTIITETHRELANAQSLDQVKSIRDKAEAVRQYARSAALGLQAQNIAAALKLRAERKAGELLSQLKLRGGDRKSKAHDESLNLNTLGINRNQSYRWQLEAKVPEKLFEQYLTRTSEARKEITAQGLLKLAKGIKPTRPPRHRERAPARSLMGIASSLESAARKRLKLTSRSTRHEDLANESSGDLIVELQNHRNLLAILVEPLVSERPVPLPLADRRMIIRILGEMEQLLGRLSELLE